MNSLTSFSAYYCEDIVNSLFLLMTMDYNLARVSYRIICDLQISVTLSLKYVEAENSMNDLHPNPTITSPAEYSVARQSSSVTSSGHLWQQRLIGLMSENPPIVSEDKWDRTEIGLSPERVQKNLALSQLLKSWREGDEKEQRDTMQYLRKALDEDRLSDRELFP